MQRTEKLRESVAELEAFSYSISHDLRSPLRAMEGYAETLLQDQSAQLDEEARHYVVRIQRAAARMDLLTRDVLAYSRMTQGNVQLRETSLEALIREVLETYPEMFGRAKIALDLPLPAVLAHEALLAQCVTNLLGNATKFVSAGRDSEVRVRAEEEGENVRVWFEDNGIGIAPEHQQQIFEIFGRVYSETRFDGTGIGLAIVKKAAERMGGGDDAIDYLAGTGKFADRTAYPVPTLLFLDLKLPIKSGFTVLAWLRDQPQFSALPVVILSSSSEPSDTREAHRLGANAYMVKPPTAASLQEVISRLQRE